MISANIPNSVRKAVYKRDGYMCALCGDTRYLQIHHYCKRSQGGCDHPMNLVTLCAHCHGVIHGNLPPVADWLTPEEMKQALAEYLGDYYAEHDEVWYPYDG